MKTIRQDAFETNSSSTHSITINSNTILYDSITPDEDGNIVLYGGQFGWDFEKFNDPLSKANYCAIDCGDYSEKKEMLIRVIKKHTGAKDVIFKFVTDYSIETPNYSYIDHQSCGTSNDAFSDDDYLKNFIFNVKSTLFTGNDNSSAPPNFYDTDVGNMRYSVSLEGSSDNFYIHESDINDEEKITDIIHNLFNDNMFNRHSGFNSSLSYEYRNNNLFGMAFGSEGKSIDFENKTVRLVRIKHNYDEAGKYMGMTLLAEKIIKFEILPR